MVARVPPARMPLLPGTSHSPRRPAARRGGRRLLDAALGLLLAIVAASTAAQGLPLPPAGEGSQRRVQVELLPETTSVAPGTTLTALLRMRIAPGWHTYWRNPGDSGLPTTLAWSVPPGIETGEIQWPVPHRLPVGPLMNYGYEREALLLVPLRVSADFSQGRLAVAARAEWLVCREVCIPESAPVAFEIPVLRGEARVDARVQALFVQARAARPASGADWRIAATHDRGTLAITLQPPPGQVLPAGNPYHYAAASGLVAHARAQTWTRHAEVLRLDVPLQAGAVPASVDGLVVFEAAGAGERSRALEIRAPLAAVHLEPGPVLATGLSGGVPADASSAAGEGIGLAVALLLAVLGGLVLNLMPCVFPVLSIKLLTLSGELHCTGHGARPHALAYALGVLATFWLLAGVLIALRSAGEQIGWGFQLQSPGFVVALAALFTLLALNLAGVFEIGSRLAGTAGEAATGHGLRGAFLNGALAVAVAAPCTAPFMGAALGYGLAQPAPVALAVFTALALGMAAPFVVMACTPALARRLPRPGPWMVNFRQAMAFPLLGTVAWLAWVLGAQAGNDAVFGLIAGLVVLSLAAWTFGRFVQPARSGRTRLVAFVLAGAIAAIGLWLAWPGGSARQAAVATDSRWLAWSEETVARLRAENRPVFIDFTAAWCVTCQVNKRVVLDSPAVVRRFSEAGVITLRADWTLRDPAITEALRRYGRSGVPVYVLYRPGASAPVVLPELLTREGVLGALAAR